jgi:CRISPR-associated protein Cst1
MEGLLKANEIIIKDFNSHDINNIVRKHEVYSYFRIANILNSKSLSEAGRELENIQIVRIHSENKQRPYSFNLLNKQLVYIIFLSRESLQTLAEKNLFVKSSTGIFYNLFEETIKKLFANQNLYSLLHLCLVSNVSFFGMWQIFEVQKNIMIIKGGKNMDKNFGIGKQIDHARLCGRDLQIVYNQNSLKKKVETITYKALNALKTKNSNKFADILLNAYMAVNKPIPTVFINTLKTEELLQALGYAFVLGLQGQEKYKEEKAENLTEGGEN